MTVIRVGGDANSRSRAFLFSKVSFQQRSSSVSRVLQKTMGTSPQDTNAGGVGAGILTGSPTTIQQQQQHHSPVRRRTNSNDSRDRHSDSEHPGRRDTNAFIAASLAARHSPTLVRSFDPNDPDVRERQRTMDVDMAMQLSRARRETVGSVTSPFDSHPPGSSIIHHGLGHHRNLHHSHSHTRHRHQGAEAEEHSPERSVFPVILDEEEELGLGYDSPHQDVDLGGVGVGSVVGVGVGGDGSEVLLNDAGSVDGDTLIPRRTRSDPSLGRTATTTAAPGVGVGGVRLEIPDNLPGSSNYGLPTYQPNASRTSFDFSRMEEFAAVEKAHLGIGSPVATRFAIPEPVHARAGRSSLTASGSGHDADLGVGGQQQQIGGGILGAEESSSSIPRISLEMQSPQLLPQLSSISGGEGDHQPQRPLRHRKISQSNSARPRPPRKGIGGKISLFESAPTEPVPRLPPLLSSNLAASSGLNPYSDFVISATTGGGAQVFGGGLHPAGQGHDRPYRFSFYSNALSATIHARSLSELPAEGQSFEDLFAGNQPQAPPPPFQATSMPMPHANLSNGSNGINGDFGFLGSTPKDRPTSSLAFTPPPPGFVAGHRTTPSDGASVYASSARRAIVPEKVGLPQGESDNTWWLDVMCPTDEEMKMLSKVNELRFRTCL
jgi:magnesium transporter